MSIASRINEMTEHLRNDWDSIDKLGLDITEENSNDNLDKNIENIAPVLNRFYNQASDKTDLSENGIVGRTSQDGYPTPENPVEINNLSGDVEYKVRGKNLFDKDNANVLNAYFAQEKVIASSSAGKTLYISCEPNTTYTVSRIVGTRFRILTTKTTPTLNVNGIDYQANDNATSLTITTSNNANYLCVYYYSSSSDTKTEQQILDSIMINEGSTPLPYEPHISESFPLSLGDIELCNISDYKDQIYSQNGKFYLEKKTGKVTLDGSENISRVSTNISGTYRFSITGPTDMKKNVDVALIPAGLVISNKFVEISNSDSYNIVSINGILVRMNNTNSFIINCIETQTYTAEQFKTWLSTHNTVVYYVLANPTTTEITEENYPTLYSQLLAIQKFLTKYKINKEFLLDYSSPEIEY